MPCYVAKRENKTESHSSKFKKKGDKEAKEGNARNRQREAREGEGGMEGERRGGNNSEKTQENMVTQKPSKQSISRSDQL